MRARVGLVILPAEADGADELLAARRTAASLVAQHHLAWTVSALPEHRTATGDPRWRAVARDDVGTALLRLCDEEACDVVGLLAAGDELRPQSLDVLTTAAAGEGWVYADEETTGPEPGHGTHCKPGFSPAYLRSTPYVGRPVLYRADVVRRLLAEGPLHPAAPEWDLALRAAAVSAPVHLPCVLVGRAVVAGPVAFSDAEAVLAAAGRRLGQHVVVEATPLPDVFVSRVPVTDPPPVSVVVPTAGASRTVRGRQTVLVENCLDGLLSSDHPDVRVVVVLDERTPDDVRDRLARRDEVRCVERSGGFDFSDIIDTGVAAVDTDLVLLLNDDTEPMAPDWLTRMVEVALQPGVGAVGAKLLFEDGRLQHVGVAHNADGMPVHVHWGDDASTDYHGSTTAILETSAVTGACLLTHRDLYTEVGGFSREFPINYNDVDYCLRLITAGYRVVQCNPARLYHYESSSRLGGTTSAEEARYLYHWGERACRDPWAQLFRWAGFVPPGLGGDDGVRLLDATQPRPAPQASIVNQPSAASAPTP